MTIPIRVQVVRAEEVAGRFQYDILDEAGVIHTLEWMERPTLETIRENMRARLNLSVPDTPTRTLNTEGMVLEV